MYRRLRAFTKKRGEELTQCPLTRSSHKATFPYRADVDTTAALPPPPPPPRPQDSPLVVRHALAQILVFTLREVEQIGRLIQSIHSTNCFHKLHQPISPCLSIHRGTYKGGYEEQKRDKDTYRRDQTRVSRLIARALPPHATTESSSEDELAFLSDDVRRIVSDHDPLGRVVAPASSDAIICLDLAAI